MEAMALLLLATARIDGDLSSDEKQELRKIFEDSFNQNTRDSSALLSSSTYLLGDGLEVFKRPQDVVSKSLEKFSSEQRESSIQLLTRISEVSGPASDSQKDYISSIRGVFYSSKDKGSWE